MLGWQIYHKDVTERLREKRLESDTDFEWVKVLRLYLEVSASARARAPINASHRIAFERASPAAAC